MACSSVIATMVDGNRQIREYTMWRVSSAIGAGQLPEVKHTTIRDALLCWNCPPDSQSREVELIRPNAASRMSSSTISTCTQGCGSFNLNTTPASELPPAVVKPKSTPLGVSSRAPCGPVPSLALKL